jgi:predicted tellurium resistance membrane protein TerC
LAIRQSATSVEISPEDERKSRLIKYSVAMLIRMACLVAGVFTTGILMWIFFSLAIFLPYFAVILANNQGPTQGKAHTSAVAPKLTLKAEQIRVVDES